jgi:hypothetical protein
MDMTRKELVKTLEAVFNFARFAGMLVFRSPLDNRLDERHIYADTNFEVCNWLDYVIDFYEKNNIPFVAYLNNTIYKEHNFQINEEDCLDE